jgi:hypothetical protein
MVTDQNEKLSVVILVPKVKNKGLKNNGKQMHTVSITPPVLT